MYVRVCMVYMCKAFLHVAQPKNHHLHNQKKFSNYHCIIISSGLLNDFVWNTKLESFIANIKTIFCSFLFCDYDDDDHHCRLLAIKHSPIPGLAGINHLSFCLRSKYKHQNDRN